MVIIKGLAEEIKKTKALAGEIDKALTKELNKLGKSWRDETRENAKVDTGLLRRSYKFDGTEKIGKEYYVEVYNNTEYAEPVEFGHREYVYGRATGRIRPGAYTLTNARRNAYKKLPGAVKRAMETVERKFNG